MRILVTGATGFIGRHVVARLLQTEHEVVATSTGRNRDRLPRQARLTFVPYDMNDPDGFPDGRWGDVDAIVHAAWEGLPQYGALFHLERNLPASCRFLKRMIEHGVRNVTVTGTCFEYGRQDGCLSETIPARPVSAYAIAKNTLREYLEVLREYLPFHLKWIRLFYMYGEGQGGKSILEQLKAALDRGDATFDMSGGEQLRDYLPVKTVADHIVDIALQDTVDGIVNCGSGRPISIRRLVETFLAEDGRTIELNLGRYPYHENEPMGFWANVDKLNTVERLS